LLLSSADLAPYLNSNNLDFVGINQAQYEQRMALPEGYYSICVKAYDYYNNTNIQVSNEACAQAWFTFSDPPFLNLPICNSVVTPQTPQNILFQWTPLNQGSPNSALNTEYEFALWEMRPDSNANPNQIVLSTAPVFSTTTQQTFLNYGIIETPLNLYMKYVWLVRVRDITGRDWFKNDGKSQTCMFIYGNAKNVLGDVLKLTLNAQTINHRAGQCDWTKQSAFTTYLLQVRKQGTIYWFDYPNVTGVERVGNLEPNKTYECRVRGEAPGIIGDWSNTALFTTQGPPTFNCDDPAMPYNTSPNAPLPFVQAIRGLIFQSGQFEVTTTQIESSGAPGWFKGRGYVTFLHKRIPVKWENIYIDLDSRQQQGVIEALTDGIDKWLHQWDVHEAEENATYVNDKIDSVYIAGNQVCYKIQGNVICVPTPTGSNMMVIRDGEGNQYSIQLIPPPPKVTGPTNYLEYSSDSLQASDTEIINFQASTNQNYGFDKKEYAAFIKNYEVIKLRSGKNYFVPNKSIGEGQTDEVMAFITIANFNPSKLSFKTDGGALLTALPGNAPLIMKVSGIPSNANYIYAWYNNKKIGKLNVMSLKALTKKLVFVPVNGASLGQQGAGPLNAVFKQANVTWSVTTASNFTFNLGNNGLEAADANLLSKYSNEMRALRDAYQKFDSLYDKSAYYLFVVPNFSIPDLKGYMVRGRAVGFISSSATVKEIVHELAHGAFGLEHTFPEIEKGSTNNLLDYTEGTQLVKKQWLMMHFGKFDMNWFDEEEDASAYQNGSLNARGVFYWINKIKVACKNNKPVVIPAHLDLIGKTKECYLGGMQFNFIKLTVQNKGMEYTADVKGKVTIGTTTAFVGNIIVTYPAILIDEGKIVISVPQERITNMKVYIEGTSTMKNLILFVNGYRPVVNMNGDPLSLLNLAEYVDSDNEVEHGDSRNYWKGIDAQFMNRIGTRNAVYTDGHHAVGTSNHLTVAGYTEANIESALIKSRESDAAFIATFLKYKKYLHTAQNVLGFTKRSLSGEIAGKQLVQKINEGVIVFNKQTDTLDVVSHSMGYAYAVGMLKEIKKANINLGRFYIVAPENACSGGIDWSMFIEVWQYGSNLGQGDEDYPWDQDGVAPQCAVPDINTIYAHTKNGRVFIPKTWKPKGFLDCHTIANYGWIFSDLTQGKKGYVKPR